jgi:hypothetical protein
VVGREARLVEQQVALDAPQTALIGLVDQAPQVLHEQPRIAAPDEPKRLGPALGERGRPQLGVEREVGAQANERRGRGQQLHVRRGV